MLIYLVGYMYSGKTTIGRELASRLGYQFLDLDQYFEERYHTSIPLFFSRYGEQAFRIIERQMLHSTAEMDNTIVSTGGGTPCHFDNMEWINSHGTSIHLHTSVETLLSRAASSRKVRPILADKTEEEREAFVRQQLALRQPYYSQAQLLFDTDKPIEHLLEQIANLSQPNNDNA